MIGRDLQSGSRPFQYRSIPVESQLLRPVAAAMRLIRLLAAIARLKLPRCILHNYELGCVLIKSRLASAA